MIRRLFTHVCAGVLGFALAYTMITVSLVQNPDEWKDMAADIEHRQQTRRQADGE